MRGWWLDCSVLLVALVGTETLKHYIGLNVTGLNKSLFKLIFCGNVRRLGSRNGIVASWACRLGCRWTPPHWREPGLRLTCQSRGYRSDSKWDDGGGSGALTPGSRVTRPSHTLEIARVSDKCHVGPFVSYLTRSRKTSEKPLCCRCIIYRRTNYSGWKLCHLKETVWFMVFKDF